MGFFKIQGTDRFVGICKDEGWACTFDIKDVEEYRPPKTNKEFQDCIEMGGMYCGAINMNPYELIQLTDAEMKKELDND